MKYIEKCMHDWILILNIVKMLLQLWGSKTGPGKNGYSS